MAFKHHFSFATDFGCNLWLQSIQNHARDYFQAFAQSMRIAHCHLKERLSCAVKLESEQMSFSLTGGRFRVKDM